MVRQCERGYDGTHGRKPSISWVVLLGAGLAVASALVLLAGPVGYRLGILPLRVALLTLLRWGAYAGIAAAVVSLIGLVVTLAGRGKRGAASCWPRSVFSSESSSSAFPAASAWVRQTSDPRHHHRHAGSSRVRRRAATPRERAQHHGVRRRKNRFAAARGLSGSSAADIERPATAGVRARARDGARDGMGPGRGRCRGGTDRSDRHNLLVRLQGRCGRFG